MTALRRRALDPLVRILAIVLAIGTAGCGPGTSTASAPAASAGRSAPAASPGGSVNSASPAGVSVAPPTTTVTEWGTIYDSLPASFPRLPGQEPADTGTAPTSGSFAANLSVSDARKLIEVSLIAQGWTVAVGSPLEDGTVVLDATGTKEGCKTEVRLTPLSGTVVMSVLYGASCPFG